VRYLSRETGLSVSDLRSPRLLIFVILNLACFSCASSVFGVMAPLFPSTVTWRSICMESGHHLSVYEWPLSYPFSLSLYNYLFYETYAFFLRQVGVAGAGIMMWGRFLTPVFPVIGAIAQWNLYSIISTCAAPAVSLAFLCGRPLVLHFNRPPLGALHTA